MSTRKFKPLPNLSDSAIRRFWSHVDKTPGQGPKGKCWTWIGGTHHVIRSGLKVKAYGQFTVGLNTYLAHRVGRLIIHGPFDETKCVLHECDNMQCVRCTFLGSYAENNADCANKGRTSNTRPNYTGEKHHGAQLVNADIIVIRDLATRGIPHKYIATRFNVCRSTISYIIQGKHWKHV